MRRQIKKILILGYGYGVFSRSIVDYWFKKLELKAL